MERKAYTEMQGLWLMSQERLNSLLTFLTGHAPAGGDGDRLQASAALQAEPGSQRAPSYSIVGDQTAMIRLEGPMSKNGFSFFSSMPQGTAGVRAMVKAAAQEPSIKSILLVVDSPGGTLAGTTDLADEISQAAAVKPVTAYIEDLGASAAYWAASRATRVVANRGALVGSIGVFSVVRDFSALFAEEKIKTHVLKFGEHKGDGTLGAEVTDDQLAEYQRIVDTVGRQFVEDALVEGRGMDIKTALSLADGRVHPAEEAVRLGLVDAVETLDEAIGNFQTTADPQDQGASAETSTEVEMAETQPAAPEAASLTDLKACLVGAGPEFIMAQLEKGATLDQARSAWAEEQHKELERLRAERDQAREDLAAKENAPGVSPLGESLPSEESTPSAETDEQEWIQLIRSYEKKGLKRDAACFAARKANPELQKRVAAAG